MQYTVSSESKNSSNRSNLDNDPSSGSINASCLSTLQFTLGESPSTVNPFSEKYRLDLRTAKRRNYTVKELERHNRLFSCWILNGHRIIDVTDLLSKMNNKAEARLLAKLVGGKDLSTLDGIWEAAELAALMRDRRIRIKYALGWLLKRPHINLMVVHELTMLQTNMLSNETESVKEIALRYQGLTGLLASDMYFYNGKRILNYELSLSENGVGLLDPDKYAVVLRASPAKLYIFEQ